jgi:hypothetical protein
MTCHKLPNPNNNHILRSNNKIKTTCDIVKLESGKRINKNNNVNTQEINLDNDSINNPQDIAKVFNEYSETSIHRFRRGLRKKQWMPEP